MQGGAWDIDQFVGMCRYKIVRGALDLNGVAGRTRSRSKYGSKSTKQSRTSSIAHPSLTIVLFVSSQEAQGVKAAYLQRSTHLIDLTRLVAKPATVRRPAREGPNERSSSSGTGLT